MPFDRLNILLITEDKQLTNKFKATLAGTAYNIVVLPAGQQSENEAKNNQCAVICCDIDLPNEYTYKLFKQIKQDAEADYKPFIFLIKANDSKSQQKVYEMGGSDIIIKPFSKYDVLFRIKSHIENYKLVNELKAKNKLIDESFRELCKVNDRIIDTSQQLIEREEELSLLAQNVPVRICKINENGKVLFSNAMKYTKLFKDKYNQDFLLHIPVQYRDEIKQKVKSVFRYKNSVKFKMSATTSSKKDIHLLSNITYLPNKKNQAVITIQDITDLEKINIALQQSEQQFKMAVRSADAGIFSMNTKTGYLYFDDRTLEMFGLKRNDFNNDYISWRNCIHPNDVSRIERLIAAFIVSPKKNMLRAEYRVLKPDNSEGYLMASMATERDKSNSPYEIFGLHIDFTEKRLAEKALKESVLKYRQLNENMQDIVWQTNKNGKITYLNTAFKTIFGFEYENNNYPYLHDIFKLSDKDTSTGLLAEIKKIIDKKDDSVNVLEFEGINKKGELVFLETTAYHSYNNNAEVAGYQGVMRNVTLRKEIEAELTMYRNSLEELVWLRTRELNESKLKYKAIIENTKDWFCKVNINGYFTFSSPQVKDILGYSEDEILGKQVMAVLPFHGSSNFNDLLEELQKQKEFEYDATTKHKNGIAVILRVSCTPDFGKDGQLVGFYGVVHNNTEKQIALRKLKRSEETFRTLLENIDEVFIIFNIESRSPVYLSPQFNRLTGYSIDEIIWDFPDIIYYVHPSEIGKLTDSYQNILNGNAVSVEFKIIRKDKKMRWILLRSFGSYRDRTNSTILYATLTDVTERKQTERRILKAVLETENREREMFAKELHDSLGANLSAIKMYLERLNSNSINTEKRTLYMKEALNLIKLAAQTSREISYGLKPHILTNMGLIKSVESLCSSIDCIGNVNIDFKHNCPDIQLTDVVELALYRIINELVNNTLKYSGAKNATIELHATNTKITLMYYDDGKGFDVEAAEKKGSSGLRNIKSRVDSFGGTLQIKSTPHEGMYVSIHIATEML